MTTIDEEKFFYVHGDNTKMAKIIDEKLFVDGKDSFSRRSIIYLNRHIFQYVDAY